MTRWIFFIVWLALTAHASADDGIHRSTQQRLTCGDTELLAKTNYILLKEPDTLLWERQSLTLFNSKSGQSTSIKVEGKLFTQPFYPANTVLDAVMNSWTCLETKSGHKYYYLAYACTKSVLRPKCTNDEAGDWASIIDLKGKKINSRLYHKLGIDEAIGFSLQLKSAVDD